MIKNLDFKYLSAHNFVCFGPKGIEIDLKKYGNIVLINGSNLDADPDSFLSSNGSGKSSVYEVIVYCLYGKTIKHPTKLKHANLINNQMKKKMRVEVRWGDFRVVRERKPDSLRIWENKDGVWDDEHELTLSGMPATQSLIEDKLGLNYDTFVNLFVFSDTNVGSFLESKAELKRQIIENLLSLETYRKYSEKAKELKKELKTNIKLYVDKVTEAERELDLSHENLTSIEEQQSSWEESKKREIASLKVSLENTIKELSKEEDGNALIEYEKAQSKIQFATTTLEDIRNKRNEKQNLIKVANTKKKEIETKIFDLTSSKENPIKNDIFKLKDNINSIVNKIKQLQNEKGSTCDYCVGQISEDNVDNYKSVKNKELSECENNLIIKNKDLENVLATKSKLSEQLNFIEKAIDEGTDKSDSLSNKIIKTEEIIESLRRIKKPENNNIRLTEINSKKSSLENRIKSVEDELNGTSPFAKIVLEAKNNLKSRQDNLKAASSQLKQYDDDLAYYEFWVTAFGDNGIRKWVIEGSIPALNNKMFYWLQFLFDSKIKIEFNDKLEEMINRNPKDGDPFVYSALSGGEKRKLNLALSQSFAHIRMLSSGVSPSLTFLDEVTSNIDRRGVVGIYKMILELSKNKQVFVTTHDRDLLEMLEGCEVINITKKNGISGIVD